MTTSTSPNLRELHEIVAVACRAPSMYNAQPWLWRAEDGRIELYADRTREMPAADPRGRNLLIGCGAALHHARVAAAGAGWSATVHRFPDPTRPDLLASLRFRAEAITPEDRALRGAVDLRRTDRRRFTSWPVPPERLGILAQSALDHGTRAVPIVDETIRHRLELLVARAAVAQTEDLGASAERDTWIEHGPEDGVPLATVPRLVGGPGADRGRFGAGLLAQPDRETHSRDGAILLFGGHDHPADWLGAGEGLSALWLQATVSGLSVLPLTQVVEVETTRAALRDELLGGLGEPYLLLRVGWHSAVDRPLAATPRRPLSDVLLP